tara:strand:- start:914 stop:1744 length:831 start_codon:yes stop_codon:yes gene_type:complete
MKLNEASKLSTEFYKPLQAAIFNSRFWESDNTADSLDFNRVSGEDVDQTEAAEVLGNALADYFKEINYPVIVLVRSPDIETGNNSRFVLTPQHDYYPNKVGIGGQMGLTARGRRLLYLDLITFDENLDISGLNHSRMSSDLASIIRHELIHAGQYDKRAKEQKSTRVAAKKEYEKEGWIVSSGERSEYLSSPIEIDAYAHEFAETLLRDYGLERALNVVRTSNKAEDLAVPEQFQEYLDGVASPKAFKNLMSKVYTHLIDLSERELIEAVIKRLLK